MSRVGIRFLDVVAVGVSLLISAPGLVADGGARGVARAARHESSGDPARNAEPDVRRAVRLSRSYLEAEDSDTREELRAELAQFDAVIDEVIGRLQQKKYEPVRPGYHAEQRFEVPELAEKHPDDLLYFTVPTGYRPDRPAGLVVFLHGGGSGSGRNWPEYFMDFRGQGAGDSQLGQVFEVSGMVAVGPSAPWDEDTAYRWCLVRPQEYADYLGDVIRECQARFRIDPDRVVLIGHSMGGFGAYHEIQRQPDRFAAVIANAGAWYLAHWPVIRGTPLCILHGTRDAERGRHYTDIEYARWTRKLLTSYELEHVYRELDDDHRVFAEEIAEYLRSIRAVRRDACPPRVTLASPVGFKESAWFLGPVRHNRWLSLDEAADDDGEIEYDRLESNGEWASDEFRLTHRTVSLPGQRIDAENRGDNRFVVTTRNVARFSLWLCPRMIDESRPVTVIVNGRRTLFGKVRPSLTTALDSYLRRHDWGLVYPIRLELTVR